MGKLISQSYKKFNKGYTRENAQFTPDGVNFVLGSKNIDIEALQEDGYGFRKMLGNTLFYQLTGEKIYNLFTYDGADDDYLLTYTSAGKVYLLNEQTGINTAIKTGLSNTALNSTFANLSVTDPLTGIITLYGFFCNGIDSPFVYIKAASTEVADVDTTNADGYVINGHICFAFDNRIFIADGATLHWCQYGDPTDWAESSLGAANAGNYPFDSEITAVIKYSGGFLVSTKNGFHYGEADGNGSYTFTSLSTNYAYSHNSICLHDVYTLYFSKEGVFPVEATIEDTKKLGNSLSTRIDKDLAAFDMSQKNKAIMHNVTVAGRNETWLHVPLADHPENSVIYILRWSKAGESKLYWLPPRIQQRINCLHSFKDFILSGTDDGKVLKEVSGKTFDGEVVDYQASLPVKQFTNAADKQQTYPYLLFDGLVDNNFTVDYILNGDNTTPKTFNISESGSDSAVWANDDDDEFGAVWDESYWALPTVNRKKCKKAKSKGKNKQISLQMILRSSGPSSDMFIHGIEFKKIKAKAK